MEENEYKIIVEYKTNGYITRFVCPEESEEPSEIFRKKIQEEVSKIIDKDIASIALLDGTHLRRLEISLKNLPRTSENLKKFDKKEWEFFPLK